MGTIEELQAAFADQDVARLCRHVTPSAARQAGTAAHGRATTCTRDMWRLLDVIEKGGGWDHVGEVEVIAVEERGDRATATVAVDDAWEARVPLRRDRGRWRLDGIFGAAPRDARRAAKDTATANFPKVTGSAVSATDSNDKACAALVATKLPSVGGGCRVEFWTKPSPLTIATPLGSFVFDSCALILETRIDATGRTWTNASIAGGPGSVACGDIYPCLTGPDGEPLPWRGRIARVDDRLEHRIAMCVETCVGSFVGELRLELMPDGESWRARPIDGGGSTGLRLDATFTGEGEVTIVAN